MHYVRQVPFDVPCKTRLWFNDRVAKDVDRLKRRGDPNGQFWMQLTRCVTNGFWLYETIDWPYVKHEFDQVYRVGFRQNRFRLIGFYEDGNKADFITLDCFEKLDQKLSQPQRARVAEVGRVRRTREWRKVTDGSGFPRIAR